MVIGNFLGYSSIGSAYAPSINAPARQAVTLEAKLDPQSPHEYSVPLPPKVIQATEEQSQQKLVKLPQNRDPASRAFLAVADYQPTSHKIDIVV